MSSEKQKRRAHHRSLLELTSDDHLCQLVYNCVQDTFQKMAQVEVNQGEIQVSDGNIPVRYDHDISGIVGVIQDDLEGTFSLSFQLSTIFPILTKLYKKEIDKIDEIAIDSVGELSNIVYGMLKQQLNEIGFKFKMCLPVVVVGSNHLVFSPMSSKKWCQEIHCEYGTFWAELLFHDVELDKVA